MVFSETETSEILQMLETNFWSKHRPLSICGIKFGRGSGSKSSRSNYFMCVQYLLTFFSRSHTPGGCSVNLDFRLWNFCHYSAVVAELAGVFPNVSLLGDGMGHKGMFEGLMVPFTNGTPFVR